MDTQQFLRLEYGIAAYVVVGGIQQTYRNFDPLCRTGERRHSAQLPCLAKVMNHPVPDRVQMLKPEFL